MSSSVTQRVSYTPSPDELGEQFVENRVRKTYDAATYSFTERLDIGRSPNALSTTGSMCMFIGYLLDRSYTIESTDPARAKVVK